MVKVTFYIQEFNQKIAKRGKYGDYKGRMVFFVSESEFYYPEQVSSWKYR